MCLSSEETTCFPVQSILGLYIVGAGVIMSSIAVTISVPVCKKSSVWADREVGEYVRG